jgi:hypothetical protein
MGLSGKTILLGFERDLNFTRGTKTTTGKLTVFQIEFVPERESWACYWSLDFIKPEQTRIYGVDPLDCLTAVLWQAAELVRDSGYPDLQVWWKERGDNAGLPRIEGETFKDRRAPLRKQD